MNTLFGLLFVLILFGCWVGSVAFLFGAVLACFHGMYSLLGSIVLYYSFRYLIPIKSWLSFRQFVCYWINTFPYFKSQQVVFEDSSMESIPPNSKSLLAYHPHGILCCGWTITGGSSFTFFNSDIKWLVAENLCKVPLISDIIVWMNGGAATKEVLLNRMSHGKNIALLPGGFEEATVFSKGQHRIFIKSRKGFLKYALQHGYKIYPTYVFGEEETYNTWNSFESTRLWLNKYKIPSVMFYGKWWCFYLPNHEVDLVTVVGKPMELPQIKEPTQDDINQYHDKYIQEITRVFDTYKAKYAKDPKATLHLY